MIPNGITRAFQVWVLTLFLTGGSVIQNDFRYISHQGNLYFFEAEKIGKHAREKLKNNLTYDARSYRKQLIVAEKSEIFFYNAGIIQGDYELVGDI